MADYTNTSQQNLLRVFEWMTQERRYLTGVSLDAVAESLTITRDQAYRTLWNLQQEEWVINRDGKFFVSPKVTRFAARFLAAVNQVKHDYLNPSAE